MPRTLARVGPGLPPRNDVGSVQLLAVRVADMELATLVFEVPVTPRQELPGDVAVAHRDPVPRLVAVDPGHGASSRRRAAVASASTTPLRNTTPYSSPAASSVMNPSTTSAATDSVARSHGGPNPPPEGVRRTTWSPRRSRTFENFVSLGVPNA